MNAVWNSYGQLCGCPEIFKKSCKFFCRELDIRVPQIVYANPFHPSLLAATVHFSVKIAFADGEHPAVRLHSI